MRIIERRTRKWIAFILLFIVAAGLFLSGQHSRKWAATSVSFETDLTIPEPPWGKSGKVAQQHVAELRERLERAKADPATRPAELSQAFGELGEVYLAYDIPAGAIACFRNAAYLDARQFRWPFLEAMAHFAGIETQAGADAMTEALGRMRRDATTGRESTLAALCFLGESCIRLNDPERARGYLDEALRLAPDCLFALFKRGQLAAQEGDSAAAIDNLQRAFELCGDAKPSAICLAIATEFQKLGKQDEADRYRRMAQSGRIEVPIGYPNPLIAEVRSQNRSATSLARTVEAELVRGNYEGALVRVNEGSMLAPDSLNLRLMRAEALVQLERIDEAIAELEEIRRRDGNGQAGRALLYETLARRPATRQKALNESLAWRNERPTEFRPKMTLGAVYFQLARYSEARESFEIAARMAPQETGPKLAEIRALCALGNYPAAVREYDLLRSTFPADIGLRHNYARFLVACPDNVIRNPQRGLAIMRELISVRSSAVFRETLACALAACGQMADARKLQSETVREFGQAGQPAIRRRLGLVLKSFDSNQPWREPWPFAEIEENE